MSNYEVLCLTAGSKVLVVVEEAPRTTENTVYALWSAARAFPLICRVCK